MGYSTYHTISCSTEGEAHDLTEDMCFKLKELSGYSENHFDGCENAKWYDCFEHMVELSATFPASTFRVDGVGDEAGDVWVWWFHHGGCTGAWDAPPLNAPSGFEPPAAKLTPAQCWVGIDREGTRWYFDTEAELLKCDEPWNRTYTMTEDLR